jgi:hypothetical protein
MGELQGQLLKGRAGRRGGRRHDQVDEQQAEAGRCAVSCEA